MIRRFMSMMVFTTTVWLAAFGQNIFGRNDIIAWAHRIQHEGPKHVQVALHETDKMLAQISPEAGQNAALNVCWIDDLKWAETMSVSSSPLIHTSL